MWVDITHPDAKSELVPRTATADMLLLNTALLGWQQLGKVTPDHCLYLSAFQHCSSSLQSTAAESSYLIMKTDQVSETNFGKSQDIGECPKQYSCSLYHHHQKYLGLM